MEKGSLPTGDYASTKKSNTTLLTNLSGRKVICKTFRQGDAMPPHHASVDVFVLVLEGQMDITLDEVKEQFGAGDYVVFPAGHTHALHCLQDARILIYK